MGYLTKFHTVINFEDTLPVAYFESITTNLYGINLENSDQKWTKLHLPLSFVFLVTLSISNYGEP